MARYVNLDKIEAQLMQMYKCVPFAVKQIFDEAEVEEVVSVEQVARMLAKFTGMPPCAFENLPWSDERLEHCTEHCGIDDSDVLCWESALKEGWLE